MVYIVPDDYTDQATAPVGTGPFRFVSRSVQQNLVMEKFADYWGEGASLDKVTFQIFEDSNALMSALSAESVDMAVHLTIRPGEHHRRGDLQDPGGYHEPGAGPVPEQQRGALQQ